MAARLADIAAQARVSEATVSRVLNGKPGVADSTRQAVLTALDVLGYERPTRLRRKSAGLVGLIVPELANPIFPAFAQVIETALARHGFTPVLCTQTPGGVHEDDYTQMLLERSVSGIIFVSGLHADSLADHERYRQLTARGLPIVLVNGYADDVEAPCVSQRRPGRRPSWPSRTCGRWGTPGSAWPSGRSGSCRRSARSPASGRRWRRWSRPAEIEDLIERSLFTVEGGQAAAQRLLDRGCTAIVCGSDLMALGRDPGRPVDGPAGAARTCPWSGYDDSPLVAFTDPPLTTLRQSVQAMGEAAVRALVDEISGQPAPRAEYVFRPELVVRGLDRRGAGRVRAASRRLTAAARAGSAAGWAGTAAATGRRPGRRCGTARRCRRRPP